MSLTIIPYLENSINLLFLITDKTRIQCKNVDVVMYRRKYSSFKRIKDSY